MGQWSGLWTENARGNRVWKANFGSWFAPKCQGVARRIFKLRRYSGIMRPQPVWHKSTGREDSTPKVCGSIGESLRVESRGEKELRLC
jgi:hypothetical protein